MLALVVALAFSTASGSPLEWAKARARELEAQERASPKAGGVWKERPAGLSVLPREFIPPISLAPLVRAVSPGVVNISVSGPTPPPGTQGGPRSLGSGFILGPDGYVVTNYHVVDKGEQIHVTLGDGREFGADVVGKDDSTDLALLKLSGEHVKDLPFVFLGDSDRLEVGDWVVAIGNPFGFDHSVSHGMISAKERVLGVGVLDDFIQTDALMNPGNSGGPLFNMRGEVVGVNTAIVSHAQGIGFAVPINMVKDLLPNLRENGRLARGWLGLTVQEQPLATDPTRRVAVVQELFAGGPAMEAGLHQGDLISAVNGRPIDSYLQLLRKVSLVAPGSVIRLTVHRGTASREVTVQVTERPAPKTPSSLSSYGSVPRLGLTLQDLDVSLGSALHVTPYHGVRVAEVLPDSPAGRAGVLAGDILTDLNHRRVEDIHTFREELDRQASRRSLMLRVERGAQTLNVDVKL